MKLTLKKQRVDEKVFFRNVQNCNVTINFNWILSMSFEQQNWGLSKLEYSSRNPLTIRAQPRAQAPLALSSNRPFDFREL